MKNLSMIFLFAAIASCSVNKTPNVQSKNLELTEQINTSYKGNSERWTTTIANGITMATIRATNYDNISLRVVCGTDGIEKLMLSSVFDKNMDSNAANKLNDIKIPLQFYFDNDPAINLTSYVVVDTRNPTILGHQIVFVTPPLLSALENNNKLEIISINERYEFLLIDAKSTINKMKCSH